MLTKIISVIMSFVLSVTGFFYTSFTDVIDSVSEMIFGVPYTAEAIKADFFSEIDDNDVVAIDENSGFVEDLIAVFIDDDLSFSEKITLFGKTGGVLVGWSSVADLYVLRYFAMNYNQINSICNKLEQNDGILLAMPVTTSKTVPDTTPGDPFDEFDFTTPEWDELNPQGSNHWLETIQARQAWDYSEYFNKINIGIIDAGFDLDHPEFDGKISFPSSRLANRNYQSFHGCHVAGIIGAKHNGVGIAGVCDNSQLICIDWEPELLQFWNTELAVFFGFSELVKAGAKVINLSLGTSGSKESDGNGFFDEYIVTAAVSLMMSSLLSKGYDFVAVQSAGNGDYYGNPMNAEYNGHFASLNEKNIFTGFTGISAEEILGRVIVVASSDYDGNGGYVQSGYTNVGKAVSVSAPGSSIYSCSTDGGYEYLSGTSMSAPVVTGVASLVWSVNPDFSGSEVKDIICSSAESFAQINRNCEYVYDVDLMEYPVVNAKLAVEEAIKRTDSTVGTVSGKIIGENAAELVYNGKSHTLFSDGTYSFLASSGSGVAQVLDNLGNEIGSFEITVEAGKEFSAGEYIINSEPESEPETEIQPVN